MKTCSLRRCLSLNHCVSGGKHAGNLVLKVTASAWRPRAVQFPLLSPDLNTAIPWITWSFPAGDDTSCSPLIRPPPRECKCVCIFSRLSAHPAPPPEPNRLQHRKLECAFPHREENSYLNTYSPKDRRQISFHRSKQREAGGLTPAPLSPFQTCPWRAKPQSGCGKSLQLMRKQSEKMGRHEN